MRFGIKKLKKISRILRFRKSLVLILIFTWVFSGWPKFMDFPPSIQRAQAAITYVGGASATGNSANFNVSLTALTGGSGSAAAAGDIVIVVDGFVSTTNLNPGVSTAGYAELADLYASDSDDANLSVNWKIMPGTPDTVVNCLGSAVATNGAACVVQVWRGMNPTTPIDVTTTTAVPAANIGTSVPDAPSITPITTGAIVLAVGVGADAAADATVTAPTFFANQVHASIDPGLAVRTSIASRAGTGGIPENPNAWTGVTTTAAGSWVAATVALRPLIPTSFTQTAYRWYVDNDTANPTDPWGTPDIAENTVITTSAADDPPSSTQELRLRVNMTVNGADLVVSSQQFKLQFKADTDGSCTTGSWTDVGAVGTSAWQFAASTVADGADITKVLTTTTAAKGEEYAKTNPTQINHVAATIGEVIEYDFHIIGSGTDFVANTQYGFRILESDATVLDAYTNCPNLTTEPAAITGPTTDEVMRHGNWFSGGVEDGFFWAD